MCVCGSSLHLLSFRAVPVNVWNAWKMQSGKIFGQLKFTEKCIFSLFVVILIRFVQSHRKCQAIQYSTNSYKKLIIFTKKKKSAAIEKWKKTVLPVDRWNLFILWHISSDANALISMHTYDTNSRNSLRSLSLSFTLYMFTLACQATM